jgi:hypothetical protein
MHIARCLDPFWRDDAQGLHAEWRALAFTCPQLCLVGFEGGEIAGL